MPRRGDHCRDFPAVEGSPETARIGVRVIRGHSRRGEPETVWVDPAEFCCRDLAAELADEWVDYATMTRLSAQQARNYRQAIQLFCRAVDDALGETAGTASLARSEPDLAFILADWERRLPSGYRPGSTVPALLASEVRALIGYRAQQEHRPVDPRMRRLLRGHMGVAWGATNELDEFSRKDKRAVVRAARTWTAELERRLTAGWAWAARGSHPADHGWTDVANLLWGLAHLEITPIDIRANLPMMREWPPELRACIETADRPVYTQSAKQMLVR
ncbi:hypothetical protein ACIA5H_30050 [Nocardia sp. NPDC051900]|uniref:hypothetical protein n=1 Tax=Nocardia sp. NPDC051900 TaxID=3364326 RepID=UPI0037992DD8